MTLWSELFGDMEEKDLGMSWKMSGAFELTGSRRVFQWTYEQ